LAIRSGSSADVTLPGATAVKTMFRGLAALGCFLASSIRANDARAAVLSPSTPRFVQSVEDFALAFSTMQREQADGFLVPPSPLTNSQPVALAELGLKYRLLGMFENKDNVRAGGLMSYGADFNYMYKHAAIYIDKILKGEKLADSPVEQASKYDLVLNLKTARIARSRFPTDVARPCRRGYRIDKPSDFRSWAFTGLFMGTRLRSGLIGERRAVD
jgi:putative tryptophan/tyrosine transport system substrate-binding protein